MVRRSTSAQLILIGRSFAKEKTQAILVVRSHLSPRFDRGLNREKPRAQAQHRCRREPSGHRRNDRDRSRVGHAVLGVIQAQAGSLDGHSLAALRIVRKKLVQM